jgi:hypothetical protein
VESLAKRKGCELVGEWVRSMVNHLYWSVISTTDGDKEMISEKWSSLANHIHDKHSGHGSKYKRCQHRRIKRKWFKYSKLDMI